MLKDDPNTIIRGVLRVQEKSEVIEEEVRRR